MDEQTGGVVVADECVLLHEFTMFRRFTRFDRRTRKIYHQNALAVTNGAKTTDHRTIFCSLLFPPHIINVANQPYRVVVGEKRPFPSTLPTGQPMVPEI